MELSNSLCECVTDATPTQANTRTNNHEDDMLVNKPIPPKCEGGTDPMVYEEWLRRIGNLFEIVEFPKRFKVHLATYQFEKEAEFW